MIKHTPGPWKYNTDYIENSVGKNIADLRYKNGDNDGTIMAAAPELLEACKKVVVLMEEEKEYMREGLYPKLRQAIAKAEGAKK